ncbi:MAG: hypothetical protein AB7T06_32295 [Kofleriaceae bacterium]
MSMRWSLVAAVTAALVAPAAADTFGGFSGVERHYLVNQDKICTPLPATATSGSPTCEKAGADVVAKLSIKTPLPQKDKGDKAAYSATASGRTLTITRNGATVVEWTSNDPISRIVEVYSSEYNDRVAVAYTARRMGKDVTDVIAFTISKGAGTSMNDPKTPTNPTNPTTNPTTPTPAQPTVVADPRVTKAVAKARKASKAKAIAAWQAVLAIDADHSEAHYQIASFQAAAKKKDAALAELGALASSTRPDAIEWLIEARYAAAFASLRADPGFRQKTGLDRKAGTPVSAYERLMGFGGQWEQTGTSCDKPEVKFTATRDRVVRIRVKSKCGGEGYDLPFKGTWRLDGDRVVLTFATRGKAVTAEDEAACKFEPVGDEDSLRCVLGRDIDFAVLPTRR